MLDCSDLQKPLVRAAIWTMIVCNTLTLILGLASLLIG